MCLRHTQHFLLCTQLFSVCTCGKCNRGTLGHPSRDRISWTRRLSQVWPHIAARLVFYLMKYDHITPAPVKHDLLLAQYRIETKHCWPSPKDSREGTRLHPRNNAGWKQREKKLYTLDKREFAVCGPLALNCLLMEIRLSEGLKAFKRSWDSHISQQV